MTKDSSQIDRQLTPKTPRSRIPIISTALHVASVTILVFLRRRFGYAYLQPLGHFLTLGFSLVIFAAFAWVSRDQFGLWEEFVPIGLFVLLSLILLLCHCLACQYREWRQSAPHDHFSGQSWLSLKSTSTLPEFLPFHFYLEVCLTFAGGALLFIRLPTYSHLGLWLMIAAICLSIKEPMNLWYQIRMRKMNDDSNSESQRRMKGAKTPRPHALRNAPKAKEKKQKAGEAATADSSQRIRFAAILEMEPPYTLNKAESAYRALQMEYHPDSNPETDSGHKLAELREAIEFFRTHLTQ